MVLLCLIIPFSNFFTIVIIEISLYSNEKLQSRIELFNTGGQADIMVDELESIIRRFSDLDGTSHKCE